MGSTPVLVTDAASTDGTREIASSFRDRLLVSIIPGGRPAQGRNIGARLAETPCVLFVDADVELVSDSLVRRAVELARRKQLRCVTTTIICRNGNALDKLLYSGNNFFQYLSTIHRPFSTGMFMLFERKRFDELGGFHEQVDFAEDYLLTRQVARNKFAIVRGGVYTTNRRFQRMGHLPVARLFLTTALNYRNKDYFLRDHKYWA
jgi:glycosyltransferase involved in cell wall biosynthesis